MGSLFNGNWQLWLPRFPTLSLTKESAVLPFCVTSTVIVNGDGVRELMACLTMLSVAASEMTIVE
jgi:hypothetical protein